MKPIKIILALFLGLIALTSSGMIDVSSVIDLPAFLQTPDGLTLGMGLVVTDIVSEYGAYYEKSAANTSRLKNLLLQPAVTEKYMTQIKTDDTTFKLSNAVIGNIVQPFHKNFTKSGDQTFTANELALYHLKVDLEMYPDDIEATWLGFLSSNGLNRKDWPVVRYVMEQLVIPKIKDNIELLEIVKGEYSAPNGTTPGATGTGMNGLKYQLQSAVNAHKANVVSGMSPITSSNIFDQVEIFVDGISNVYQGVPMNVFMSPTFYRYYKRDARSQGFYNITGDQGVDDKVDFTPQNVVGLPSMAGETFIFATPKENLLYLTKKSMNKTKFKVEEYRRVVSIMTDWYEGVGFGIQEAIWTNLEVSS